MKYISNAFSLNMLSEFNQLEILIEDLGSVGGAIGYLTDEHPETGEDIVNPEWKSVVGHKDAAALFSKELGFEVACNRETVTLNKGDELVIGQYSGPRLPEGCSTLPDGATIRWMHLSIV